MSEHGALLDDWGVCMRRLSENPASCSESWFIVYAKVWGIDAEVLKPKP